MLQLIITEAENGIKINIEPEDNSDIEKLKDCLQMLQIKNPLVTFAKTYTEEERANSTEGDFISSHAYYATSLSRFWKNANGKDKFCKNAIELLYEVINAYNSEHEELADIKYK